MFSPSRFNEHLGLDGALSHLLGRLFLGLLRLWGLEGFTLSWVPSPPVSPRSSYPSGGRVGSSAASVFRPGYLFSTNVMPELAVLCENRGSISAAAHKAERECESEP